MNTIDILFYGNKTVLDSLKDYPIEKLNIAGACGKWTVKDILAHLTAFENVLKEALITTFIDNTVPTPFMKKMAEGNQFFNDFEYDSYKSYDFDAILEEYNKTANHVLELSKKVPAEKFSQPGLIPWYGAQYCVDDFIVYANYGHKREHTAQ